MTAEERAQSAPAGASRSDEDKENVDISMDQTYDEDPLLATLKRRPVKKRNPNTANWDGRVAGMTLKEYRERKWSVDAGYGKMFRGGPSWSMRPSLPSSFIKRTNNGPTGDLFRAFLATQPSLPSYSFGCQSLSQPKERSQGPAEYPIKSTMDPNSHPTCPKNRGARFGSEVLEPRDPPGPAPGDYSVDCYTESSAFKKAPNFSCQGREAWAPRTTAPGPGIGEYDYTGVLRTGKLKPIEWNMQGKTDLLKKPLGARQYINPGPDYNCPGAGGRTNATKCQEPLWKFGSEPRGLR